MNGLNMRCAGNGEITVVELIYDRWRNEIRLAEIVPVDDGMVQRRVNQEVLVITDYAELGDFMSWTTPDVEDLVVGYLNRQNQARVQLREDWAAELAEA